MVELDGLPSPNGVEPSLIDFGITLRPSTAAEVLRVDRKGSRFRLMVSHPPMKPELSKIMVSRLIRAKREGLRIAFPLIGVDQGSPGSPVVNGANPIGHTLPVRGLTPGYQGKEGFWLSIEDQNGRHYLHNVAADFTANGAGNANIPISPAIRWPFPDGSAVHLSKPMVQGFVEGEAWSWQIPLNKLIAVQYPLEEAA